MSFQTEMQETAIDLIDEFGTSVKVVRQSGSTEGRSKTVKGVITKITANDIVDGFITFADKVVWLQPTATIKPAEGDSVYFMQSKNTYAIIKVDEYNTDDVLPIVYKLIVRP